jgi:hypothetical protein
MAKAGQNWSSKEHQAHKASHAPQVEHGEYFVRASSRSGRKIAEWGPHPDRETAASEAWQKHPNAKQVSTARGPHGMDIRWHNKPS